MKRRSSMGRFIGGLGIALLIMVIISAIASRGLSLILSITAIVVSVLLIAIGQFLTYHAEMVDAMDKIADREAAMVEALAHTDDTIEIVGIALAEINDTLKEIRDRLGPGVPMGSSQRKPPDDPPNVEDEKARMKRLLREKIENRP